MIAQFINQIFWSFGIFTLYLLFIQRLKKTFQNSIYKISNCINILLFIGMIFFLLIQIADSIINIIVYINKNFNWNQFSLYTLPILILSEFLHFIISCIIVYMFISRLIQLILLRETNNFSSSQIRDDISNDLQINLEEYQQKILNVVIKYFILSTIAIISSQIFFISSIILDISFNSSNSCCSQRFNIISSYINITIMGIDCCINCLCIFLNFQFKPKWYSLICNCFRKCCQYICLKYVKKRLKTELKGGINYDSISSWSLTK